MEVSHDKYITCAQTSQERDEFLRTLPRLSPVEVPLGDFCPICLVPFSALLEGGHAREPIAPKEWLGITRLQCGHIFCMSDIAVWIHTSHGSCPTCRDLFLIIAEPSDDESSDGGEYIPGSDSVADDMMDEPWTDEGDIWTDDEDLSIDERAAEEEFWDRSSADVGNDSDEEAISALGELEQSSVDPVIAHLAVPQGDPEYERIKAELTKWRAHVEAIQRLDWLLNQEATHLRIQDSIRALAVLKSTIDTIECDTSAKASFADSALVAVREIHALIECKLDGAHRDSIAVLCGEDDL